MRCNFCVLLFFFHYRWDHYFVFYFFIDKIFFSLFYSGFDFMFLNICWVFVFMDKMYFLYFLDCLDFLQRFLFDFYEYMLIFFSYRWDVYLFKIFTRIFFILETFFPFVVLYFHEVMLNIPFYWFLFLFCRFFTVFSHIILYFLNKCSLFSSSFQVSHLRSRERRRVSRKESKMRERVSKSKGKVKGRVREWDEKGGIKEEDKSKM